VTFIFKIKVENRIVGKAVAGMDLAKIKTGFVLEKAQSLFWLSGLSSVAFLNALSKRIKII
jgi:hypothetical protein